MSARPWEKMPAAQLASMIQRAIDAGRGDARLLDGRYYNPRRWSRAEHALHELLARAEHRKRSPIY